MTQYTAATLADALAEEGREISRRQVSQYANSVRRFMQIDHPIGGYTDAGVEEIRRAIACGGPKAYERTKQAELAESASTTPPSTPMSPMPFSEAPDNLTPPASQPSPGAGYLTVIQGGQQIQHYPPTSPESRITVAFSEPNQAIAPTIFGGVDFGNHGAPIQQGGVSQAINESTATMDQLLGDATGLLALLDMTEERLNARQAQAQANTDAQNAQMDKVLVKLRQRIAQLKAVGRNAEAQALEQQVEIGTKKRELGQLVGQVESLAAAVGGSVQYSQDSP